MKYLGLITAVLFVNAGCIKKLTADDEGFRYSFSVEAIENAKLSPPEAAEEIAKGAEQLLYAKGFEQADRVATDALKLDPANLRAGFIKALLEPLLLLKGIVARLQPLAERSPKLKKDWDKEVAALRSKPDYMLNSYYLDGTPEIATEKELQNYLDKLIVALEHFRLFVRDHRNSEITMKSSPVFIPDANSRYAYSCKITETENKSYELICPPSSARHQVTLNRADFETIQIGIGFYELYLALPNSYDLTGTVDSIKGMNEVLPKDYQKIADDLMARAEFGSLRIPNTMSKARGWGLDIVNSLLWANENIELTCNKGHADPQNRPGYFINKGICVVDAFKPYLDKVEKAVKSNQEVPFDFYPGDEGNMVTVDMNVFALFERPMDSLKLLGPLKFNSCGKLVDLRDPTIGGTFPKGDALTAFGDPKCP
jgi:hypothetical protein